MGVDERDVGFPLPSKYMDTARFVYCVFQGILRTDNGWNY